MAWRLAVACFGAFLSSATGAWVNGEKEVDVAALRAKAEAMQKKLEEGERLASNNSCYKANSGYVPLDMKGTKHTLEENATMCQVRCNETDGCFRWTFYEPLSHCHITDEHALLGAGIVGFTAGPKVCRIQNCTTEATTYFPWLDPSGFYQNLSRVEALKSCQKLCLTVAACAHFVLKIPSQACHLADWKALKYQMYGSVTGPPTCEGRKKITFSRLDEELPSLESLEENTLPSGGRLGSTFALSGALVGAAALATVGFAASRARRRGRALSFDRAPQQSLEEKLSVDRVEEEEEGEDACLATA